MPHIACCRFIENPEAPIYITVGTGGAGFTHSFPTALPGWVALGAQDINGYTRFQVSEGEGVSDCGNEVIRLDLNSQTFVSCYGSGCAFVNLCD
jgi:hypothetical protein